MKSLYDVIEDFNILQSEFLYHFKANKAFLDSLLKEVYLDDRERFNTTDGIEYTQQGLLNRLEKINNELCDIDKLKKEDSKN